MLDYSRAIHDELRAHEVINGKIQRAEQIKVHTIFVIEKRNLDADAVSMGVLGKGNLGAKSRAGAIAEVL